MRTAALRNLLSGLDVPEMRRDISKMPNIRWLLRNIQVRNGDSEHIQRVMILLRQEYNELRRK